MVRKTIITALMAAVAIPTAAGAQSQAELRRDRQDIRQEQRELRNAQRRGDWRDVQRQREDVREARQEYREDARGRYGYNGRNWGRNDWYNYRAQNRNIYARGNWRAPFRYNQFRTGVRIAPNYYGQRYWINDPWRYRLPRPGVNARWIRHYNDVILVDYRRGIVLDVIRNLYW